MIWTTFSWPSQNFAPLSPKLNGAIDQAQRAVVQIENFLANECEVAIQADVPVIYNDKGVAVTLLRYGRVDGKFRIALTATDGDARFVSRAWTDAIATKNWRRLVPCQDSSWRSPRPSKLRSMQPARRPKQWGL